MKRRQRLGEVLKRTGLLTQGQIEDALLIQEKTGDRLGDICVRLGYVNGDDLLKALSEQYGLKNVHLNGEDISDDIMAEVPFELMDRNELIPVSKNNGILTVAIADPLNLSAIDDIRMLRNSNVEVVIAPSVEIRRVLDRYKSARFPRLSEDRSAGNFTLASPQEEIDLIDALEQTSEELRQSDAPVVKLVSQMILEAFRRRASDIHVEPIANRVRIRYRIDGVLQEMHALTKTLQGPVISRLKIMAKLDIAEKRLPQDGRIRLKVQNKPIDFRVSTLPSFHGESVVLRILDREQLLLQLAELGLSKENETQWKELIHRPFGILLVTGPTGSGKTTTLYTSIQFINKPNTKIITVEDPIEYQIPGINQVAIRPEIGLTFAAGLRSILRQAPNKILVGEIRDHETAAVAVEASLTGHLVFSTLHTNDAPSSISRLLDMGVRAYLVASAVQAIVAQRLVRTICPKCRTSYKPDAAMLKALQVDGTIHISNPVLYKGVGCSECSGTGYFGRIGIFELLIINDEIRELIGKRTSHTTIRECARKHGMRTLREDGMRKVLEGITTLEEIIRVTHGDLD